MIIRSERSEDFASIRQVNMLAFDNRDSEADLVDAIRLSQGFVPGLSLVAEMDGQVVGHILFSKIDVTMDQKKTSVLALAPMAVTPQFQNQGIGTKLITEGLNRCRMSEYKIIIVIGHPGFYPKFGFLPARSNGLECHQYPVPDDVFMVLELEKDALKGVSGVVEYPETFNGV